ncbi:MAG: UDP-N-acetylmuramoyl-tripeptide--D-alanyl-D-alanine ligase [Pseudomonadota bacterium]
MSAGSLSRVAVLTDGRLYGGDASWSGVSTDTRVLQAGQLFIGLNGPNFRGADFASDAMAKQASAAVVDRNVDPSLPHVVVHDTKHALGIIATDWRDRFSKPVIGVTGSNGKTTVKQLIAALLGPQAYATPGNFNNDIGVPLSLLGLASSHSGAVIEMGANALGEIAYLTSLVRPDVGLITNAGPAHLEGFGSLDGVAAGKGELFYALGADATAIINRDDTYYEPWCDMAAPARIVSFGLHESADFRATDCELYVDRCEFVLHGPDFSGPVNLPLAGGHNVVNACAAAASVWAAGVAPDDLLARFAGVVAAPSRLRQLSTRSGNLLIDDSYNANPSSMRAAAGYATSLDGDVWMALGDMGELGADAEQMHFELGRALAELGVARLLATGELMAQCVRGFGNNGEWFADHAAMIRHIDATLPAGAVLIVKGSRSARMETVVAALTADVAECHDA